MTDTAVDVRGETMLTDMKAHILAESMSLPERIALYRTDPGRFERDEALSSGRIDKWRGALGFEEVDAISDRVTSLGATMEELPLLLGRITPSTTDVEPNWWTVLEGVFSEPAPNEGDEAPSFMSSGDERQIPFEHAIMPWVVVATRMLEAKMPEQVAALAPEILRKEQRALLENLASIFRMVLVSDLETFKIQSYDSNDLFLGMTVPKPPDDSYRKFIRSILEDAWHGYVMKYPALGRLVATRVLLWIHSLAEFLEDLDADRDELQRVFSPNEPLGRLVSGARGISDSHNGARAVVVCTFENGCKIVYKPRPMSVDSAWGSVVDWFNNNFEEVDSIIRLDVVEHDHHGWMGFAEHLPCADVSEIESYFTRMGIFLCLVHMFHGNDFHLENIIASGSHPIAIDLETITVPLYTAPDTEDSSVVSPAVEIFNRSVLRTLLLPMAMAHGRDVARNLGAVGITIEGGAGEPMHRVLHAINTDFMHWRSVTAEEAEEIGASSMADAMRSKVELTDGTTVRPQDYRDKLMEGYKQAYEAILGRREEFLSEDGPIKLFQGAYVRFLNRATNIYYRLFFETCSADVLCSGVERWIATDRLGINFSLEERADPKIVSYCLEHEHEAILRGDIPYFLSRADSRTLATLDIEDCSPIECEEEFLNLSAMEAAYSQVEGMSEEDEEVQVQYIKSSYVTALISLRQMTHGGISHEDEASEDLVTASPFEEGELAEFSRQMIDRIVEEAFIGKQGQMDWVDISVDPVKDTSLVAPMDAGVYSGRSGIALLLEAAYRRFGDPKYLELANACLMMEAGAIDRDDPFVLVPGGCMASGGMIRLAWRMSRHEGQGIWHDRMKWVVNGMGPNAIQRDIFYDVIAGSAGLILILAPIYQEEPTPEIRDLIDALAQHLVKNVSYDQHGGLPSWPASKGAIGLCGFSHGITGIALALLTAWKITSKDEYRDLALRSSETEHQLRSEEHMNWPDFRGKAIGQALGAMDYRMRAWCHGSPGIMLGKAAFLEIEDHPMVRDDAEFAVECTTATLEGVQLRPHLCCGSTGNGEIARITGTILGRSELTKSGTDLTMGTLENFRMNGFKDLHGLMGLGFFQGLAGLAWAGISVEGKTSNMDMMLLR